MIKYFAMGFDKPFGLCRIVDHPGVSLGADILNATGWKHDNDMLRLVLTDDNSDGVEVSSEDAKAVARLLFGKDAEKFIDEHVDATA